MEEMTGKTRHIQSEATQGKVVSENPGSKCLGLLHLGLVLDGRHADQPFLPERVSLWRFASWKSADLQTRGAARAHKIRARPHLPRGTILCLCNSQLVHYNPNPYFTGNPRLLKLESEYTKPSVRILQVQRYQPQCSTLIIQLHQPQITIPHR